MSDNKIDKNSGNKSDKKIALVTGASRGIGQAIARELAATHTVIGTATTESGAAGISKYLQEIDAASRGLVLNVSDASSIDAFFAQLKEEYDAPQILVNNAGITRDNLMLRMKEDEWADVIDTNLTAVFKLSKAVLKGMTRARWGRIINISSVVGTMGNAGQANYAATKAGVIGFSKSLAREVGSRNITVNTIAPGFIDTDMTRALNDDQREAMLTQIPLGRLGASEEIASLVAFLASASAGYITGETIHINGGMYMS